MSISDHLDKISAFKSIVETGKLSEASKRLGLSQPSLTRLIQTLETAAGARLLHRSRQGVSLTNAGKLLFEFSKMTLGKLDDLEEQIKSPALERAGLLRVGSYESLAEYLWPNFVVEFRNQAPELKLSIRTTQRLNHQSALEQGDLDILIDAEPRVLGDFTSWVLYEDRFNFYGFRSKIPKSLRPRSIESLSLIYCPQAFDQHNKGIISHMEGNGYFFKEKTELDSFTAVRTFCRSGIGLGVLPMRLAEVSSDLSPIYLEGFSRHGFGTHSICATVHNRQKDDRRIKFLIKSLKAHYKK